MTPLPNRPALPREHGAWVMLTLPLVLGAALAGPRPNPAWLLPVAVVAVFLAQYALVPLIQRALEKKPAPVEWRRSRLLWGTVYLIAAVFSFALVLTLTIPSNRGVLIQLAALSAAGGAVYVAAACTGLSRLVVIELVGMAAMSLGAPMMAVAVARSHERKRR